MTVEKISENLGKIENFIQLLQALYAQELGHLPNEDSQLQILGIDWQDGLTLRIKKTEHTSQALEKACEKIEARLFKTTTNYSLKFTSLDEAISSIAKMKTM